MARALDWEGANRRDRDRARSHRAKTPNRSRELALAAFVAKHDLQCFKCTTGEGPWAKTGFSLRGPWAICVACVTGPSE